ncbi:hypothetical protein PC128_g26366 [Phytophthora cactorum]|nr:hypothetical protein PC128_g26366 [Phytophthora cactorum]
MSTISVSKAMFSANMTFFSFSCASLSELTFFTCVGAKICSINSFC